MDFLVVSVFRVNIISCLLTLVSLNFVSLYVVSVSYADHCSSLISESAWITGMPITSFPPEWRVHDGYCTGGDRLLNLIPSPISSGTPNLIRFWTERLYLTEVKRIYILKAELEVETRNGDNYIDSLTAYTSWIRFKLEGLWDESSGKLCMVGSSSTKTRSGTLLHLPVVLKLDSFKNSSSITSLVTGMLESLSSVGDSNSFQPISVLMFPHMNYKYTLVSEEMFDSSNKSINDLQILSLGSNPIKYFCRFLSSDNNKFHLKYAKDCNSLKNCNPFSGPDEYLPPVMHFSETVHRRFCLENKQNIRLLLDFFDSSDIGYYRPFNPNTTLVAEGLWDEKKNQLFLVACRVLNASHSLADARIDDCSTRLSLRFPAVWSIRETSSIVGQIWSTKAENGAGYFKKIDLSSAKDTEMVPGFKYEYTEIDRSLELCSRMSKIESREKYPNGYSFGMTLHDMIVKNSEGKTSKGYAAPLTVGDQFYGSYSCKESLSQVNISYKMSFLLLNGVLNLSSRKVNEVEIIAEGVYYAETGSLCMIGCQNLVLDDKRLENHDCAIVVNLQFPPYNSRTTIYTKGSIESTREISDPLHFKRLELSALSFYAVETREYIRRMEFRVSADLLSKSFSCVFLGLQLLHIKRYPHVLPFISVFSLLSLTLCQTTLLVLDFHGEIVLLGSVWLETSKVNIRVATMTSLLLQFFLVKLILSARVTDRKQKRLWDAEKRVMFASFPIHFVGLLIALFLHWMRNAREDVGFNIVPSASHVVGESEKPLLKDLKSYVGFLIEAFLFPQIIFNVIENSKERALACPFYIGSAFVKLLSRMYFAHGVLGSEVLAGRLVYVDPDEDFVSDMWAMVSTFVGFVFGAIIWLQQHFGGGFILSRPGRIQGGPTR